MPELEREFTDLSNAGWPERMTHGNQAARRAYGNLATNVESALTQQMNRFAGFADAHRLDVLQLFYGKRVMQLQHIDFGWCASALRKGIRNCGAGDGGICTVLPGHLDR
jgi:hypothetical protein